MATYAFTDLHGNYKLWDSIHNYLKKDDIAFCLGDCCDRGPDGIKIMQEMLIDSRIIYLLGNHEVMLVDAVNKSFESLDDYDKYILKENGTLETLYKYQELKKEQQEDLINKLNQLPIKYLYINKDNKKIFLSHAGCNPPHMFNANDIRFIWDRKHLTTEKWEWDSDLFIVHGHTPVQTLQGPTEERPNADQVLFYCNNHKIDLDLGSFVNNVVALLNLDTFEVLYFIVDNN